MKQEKSLTTNKNQSYGILIYGVIAIDSLDVM